MKQFIPFILIILVSLTVARTGEARQSIFVSILPQKYMVERIGKNKVHVNVIVAPGANPHTYEPKPAQMAILSKAQLYFSIGVPFENFWLDKIAAANPKMKIIHTDEGIHKLPMTAYHKDKHHTSESYHDEHSSHGHAGMDPHIWTSPILVKQQAETICKALSKEDPSNAAFYASNLNAFIWEIQDLDQQLHDLFQDKPGTRFMAFHPAWGYFARDYGLEMIPIEMEGKDPKPAQLMRLIKHARAYGIRVIFVQPQFSSKSAALIAREIKGRVVAADPLAYQWMDNLKTIAAQFKGALK
ncbi:MAG: cation ABC transporter substrate-binding protein [Desulfobacterales bacterium]|nr:MAG: cation ABC transporter substrate-binding protein [Desulfobacterales bacterium]